MRLIVIASELLVCAALSTQLSRRALVKGASCAVAPGLAAGAPPGVAAAVDAVGSPSGPFVLPKIGVGAWAWGDSLFWKYDPSKDGELQEVFDATVDAGVRFFDTAEVYGLGRSEKLLGQFCRNNPSAADVKIATKFAALPWRTKASDVLEAAKRSTDRLQRPIDLYQIHFPNACAARTSALRAPGSAHARLVRLCQRDKRRSTLRSHRLPTPSRPRRSWANEAYWDGLGSAVDSGLVRAAGVSNYGVDATRACHAKLASRGVKLVSNQVQLSLVYPYALQNGLKAACDELGVGTLAYSPLGLGVLTGKFSATNLPSGPRSAIAEQFLADPSFGELIRTMRAVGEAHGGATPAEVALGWTIAKGATPIPGARTLAQVRSNLRATGLSLSSSEVATLDAASAAVSPVLRPELNPFPKEDVFTKLHMYDS